MKSTILIIDDSPVLGRFLEIFFSKKYDVIVRNDSFEALSLLEDGFEPDAIITDLEMPGLSGIAIINAVRAILPYTPLFVVSGLNESKFRLAALRAGADDFLPKPFHPAELELRVEKMIAQKMETVDAGVLEGGQGFSWFSNLLRVSPN